MLKWMNYRRGTYIDIYIYIYKQKDFPISHAATAAGNEFHIRKMAVNLRITKYSLQEASHLWYPLANVYITMINYVKEPVFMGKNSRTFDWAFFDSDVLTSDLHGWCLWD